MTSETEHFKNAPIVEALVGVDLEEMLGDDSLGVLKRLGDTLQQEYPTREDIVMGQVEFALAGKQVDAPLVTFLRLVMGDKLSMRDEMDLRRVVSLHMSIGKTSSLRRSEPG